MNNKELMAILSLAVITVREYLLYVAKPLYIAGGAEGRREGLGPAEEAEEGEQEPQLLRPREV